MHFPFYQLFFLLLSVESVSGLWFEHFLGEKKPMPSRIEEFEMRSHLTINKTFDCSIRGYLQSILWLRTRRTMPKVKDIYDYWRLAHSLHKFDHLMHEQVSKMLLVDCIRFLFWRELKAFFELKHTTMSAANNVKKIPMPPELVAILTIYNPAQMTRVLPFKEFRSIMYELLSREAREFADQAFIFWVILTNMPEPSKPFELIGRSVVLNIILQKTVPNNTISELAAGIKHKILVLKAEILMLAIDVWFAKAAVNFMFNLVWLIQELERSRAVYELEAELRTLIIL